MPFLCTLFARMLLSSLDPTLPHPISCGSLFTFFGPHAPARSPPSLSLCRTHRSVSQPQPQLSPELTSAEKMAAATSAWPSCMCTHHAAGCDHKVSPLDLDPLCDFRFQRDFCTCDRSRCAADCVTPPALPTASTAPSTPSKAVTHPSPCPDEACRIPPTPTPPDD